jgi:hypothetical protein
MQGQLFKAHGAYRTCERILERLKALASGQLPA